MRTILTILLTAAFLTNLASQTAEEAVNLLEDEQGFGARATALGNAYTALADDYSAIYYNPAGLARVKIGQFSGSLSNFKFQTDAKFLGNSFSEDVSSTKLQHLGLVFPFPVVRGSFVIALGYQKVKDFDKYLKFNGYREANNGLAFEFENDYGQSNLYGFDEHLQQDATSDAEGSLSQWSFGMAMDFSPNFSAGLSLNIYSGSRNDNFKYRQDDVNGWNSWYMDSTETVELQYVYYELEQKLKSEFSGFEFNLGGLFDIIPQRLKIGANITFPVSFKVDENWSANDYLAYDIVRDETSQLYSAFDDKGNFDYIIKVPFKFSGGLAFNYSLLTISAAVNYQDWSQLKYEKPDDRPADQYTDLLSQNNVFKDAFQAVTSYSLGGELNLLDSRLKLRAGYRNAPSPVKELGADYNKKYISGGLGYQVDKSTIIHLTYVRGSWKSNRNYYYGTFDDDGYADPLETTQDIVTSKVLVGIQVNFR
jgi:long-subunit fatty acid transport protein